MADKTLQAVPAPGGAHLIGELSHSIAPMPTKRTVRMRTSVPYQIWRFVRVNSRMIKMIRRSHSR